MILLAYIFSIFLQIPTATIYDGYSNHLSAFPGDSIDLYLNASEQQGQVIKLFNLQGQEVAKFPMTVFPQQQAKQKPWENGFDYKLTKRIAVPALKSGVYMWENTVPLVIKNVNPKIVVLYSSNTESAYCNAGGKSLYDFNSLERDRARKISLLRPVAIPRHAEAFLRWMEKQPFEDVGYITDLDMDDFAHIKKSSLIIIAGHSEYWTLAARKNFDRFVGDGKPALVLSGNTMWWQVRYNKEKDQMICYRNIEDDDIKSSKQKTINWNDPILGYSILCSIGADFTTGGYGRRADPGWDGFKIIRQSPLLENTTLKKGDIIACASDEADSAPLISYDSSGIPILNKEALGFQQIEIVGFDRVRRAGGEGACTWIVFKATRSSGVVINTGSTDWCSDLGIGSNDDIKIITTNMINKLLKKENVFSPEEGTEVITVINN